MYYFFLQRHQSVREPMMSIVPEEGSLTPSDAQAKSPTPSKIHNTVNNFHKTLFRLHIFKNVAKVVRETKLNYFILFHCTVQSNET